MFIMKTELACIIFIMGRPGSGKSLTARCIQGQSDLHGVLQTCLLPGWDVQHLTDYPLLRARFLQEERTHLASYQKRFARGPQDSFAVKDFSVLREVLVEMSDQLVQSMTLLNSPTLFLVEFARDDYGSWQDIWGAFADSVRENAYCLCLQAALPLCLSRVYERANKEQPGKDDNLVPNDIMFSYYPEERFIDVQEIFGMTRVEIVDNNGAWLDAWAEISSFVHSICVSREMFLPRQPVPVPARKRT